MKATRVITRNQQIAQHICVYNIEPQFGVAPQTMIYWSSSGSLSLGVDMRNADEKVVKCFDEEVEATLKRCRWSI